MKAPSALDIVIVSYRCESLLRSCLTSLREHPPLRAMSVHVIDNDPRDGTADMVAREFPDVKLTRAARNLGFSAASNIGIGAGSGDYVLILNPDTRMAAGALDSLLDLMDHRPEIGISGPRLQRDDGRPDHAAKRSFPTPLSALAYFTGAARFSRSNAALGAYTAPDVEAGPVDAVNGAFMLIRREALEQVGAFDEGYWMYMEDLDLCYRFAEAGWVTWYEPTVTVHHMKAGSSGPHRSFRLNRAFHYGMYRFYRKHYAAKRSPLVNVAVYAGIALKLCVSALRSAAARATAGLRGRRAAAG